MVKKQKKTWMKGWNEEPANAYVSFQISTLSTMKLLKIIWQSSLVPDTLVRSALFDWETEFVSDAPLIK